MDDTPPFLDALSLCRLRSSRPSHTLMTLPPEIRLQIYDYMLPTGCPQSDYRGLLSTNRFLRSEFTAEVLRILTAIYQSPSFASLRGLFKIRSPQQLRDIDVLELQPKPQYPSAAYLSALYHLNIPWDHPWLTTIVVYIPSHAIHYTWDDVAQIYAYLEDSISKHTLFAQLNHTFDPSMVRDFTSHTNIRRVVLEWRGPKADKSCRIWTKWCCLARVWNREIFWRFDLYHLGRVAASKKGVRIEFTRKDALTQTIDGKDARGHFEREKMWEQMLGNRSWIWRSCYHALSQTAIQPVQEKVL